MLCSVVSMLCVVRDAVCCEMLCVVQCCEMLCVVQCCEMLCVVQCCEMLML